MVSVEREYLSIRLTLRAHLGAALATMAVFAAIASTGLHVLDLAPPVDKEKPVYYLAPPKEYVETRSLAPDAPVSIDATSLNVDLVESEPELDLRPLDIAIDSDVSSNVTLNFDLARDFAASAPGVSEFDTFTIYDPGEVDEPPLIRFASRPDVPRSLRGERVEVIVFYYVTAKGRTERPSVLYSSSDNPVFGEAAKEALKFWRFKPAEKAGEPVPCWVQQTINFAATSTSPFTL